MKSRRRSWGEWGKGSVIESKSTGELAIYVRRRELTRTAALGGFLFGVGTSAFFQRENGDSVPFLSHKQRKEEGETSSSTKECLFESRNWILGYSRNIKNISVFAYPDPVKSDRSEHRNRAHHSTQSACLFVCLYLRGRHCADVHVQESRWNLVVSRWCGIAATRKRGTHCCNLNTLVPFGGTVQWVSIPSGREPADEMSPPQPAKAMLRLPFLFYFFRFTCARWETA